uniref:Uncharacterized protein n=1 Tax=Arundo donax TaxID=35708 RepID=A0A0A9EHA4_ARUDO
MAAACILELLLYICYLCRLESWPKKCFQIQPLVMSWMAFQL